MSEQSSGNDREYGRTPPQDNVAEQSVLGGMMLSKDAIADVVEVLRGVDFYKPAHESIYEAIISLYGRGEPADAITVSDELTKRGEIERIGGPAYLHTLISSVPTAANAGFYAEIVRERGVLRRLVEAGTKIVQLGYSADGEVDDIVNEAQAEIYQVAERRSSEDYTVLKEVVEATVDEIEAAGTQGEGMRGVPTGFIELDELTQGFQGGQMIVIAARPAMGKALALDTAIPTPTGWTTMGEIAVGDEVIAADGTPSRVVAATEVMTERPCYRVTFDDGSEIVADEQHQWLTETRSSRKSAQAAAAGYNRTKNQGTFAEVRTTADIRSTLRCATKDGRLNHSVKNSKALRLSTQELPVGPYTLGAWLGDGHSNAARITSADDGILLRISAEGYRLRQGGGITYSIALPEEDRVHHGLCEVCGKDFSGSDRSVRTCSRACGGKLKGELATKVRATCIDCGEPCAGGLRCMACHQAKASLQGRLRALGVLGNKRIPMNYLRASEMQRRELLAGLLDTDGTVTNAGCIQFAVTNRRLAEDVRELVHSLGYRSGWAEKKVNGRTEASSIAYLLTFSTNDQVFGLARKQIMHKERDARSTPKRSQRFITAVEPIASVPVRCIEIDHPSHLYLAGRTFIPTHNSTLALDVARSAAIKHNMTTVIFSLEMSRNEIAMRLLSAEATLNMQDLRKGRLQDEQWAKIATTMGKMDSAPLFIDDSPNMSLMEIRAKCRRLKQKHDLKLVVLDYLQLMSSGKKVESRQQEVSEFSRALKLLAKELEVPVIALSQLNRGSEQRQDKKPMVSDLRESGCLTADTRILRSDTGAEVTMGELFASGAKDVPVWSLGDDMRYVERRLTHVFSTGVKQVHRLTLASGKTIRATANHPFFTYRGWKPLGELSVGDRLGVPRHTDGPTQRTEWDDAQVDDAARALAAGSAALNAEVFSLPKAQIRRFVQTYWAARGTVVFDGIEAHLAASFDGSSVADRFNRLLLRFGISTSLTSADDGAELVVAEQDDQVRFLKELGRSSAFGDAAQAVLEELDVPVETAADTGVWQSVGEVLADPVPVGTLVRDCVDEVRSSEPAPKLAQVATMLDDASLDLTAVNDLLWDTVVSIEHDGEEEVFDATVLGHHNFIANGITVHNSIEQDADMVILLHRDDVYDKESPRAGEADVIVAKHRNGPTKTIVVAFQGHYSRFANMAHEGL